MIGRPFNAPITPVFKPSGFLKIGTIISIDPQLMRAGVSFGDSTASDTTLEARRRNQKPDAFAQIPVSFVSSSGGFIGGGSLEGTSVAVAPREGSGDYIIVAFLAKDPSANIDGFSSSLNIPDLTDDNIYIQSDSNIGLILNKTEIKIGDPINSLTFNIDRATVLNTFDKLYNLTEASREITGVILRDKRPTTIINNILKNTLVSADDTLKEIGMDPISNTFNSTYSGNARNPARVEKREVIFEYIESAQVQSNDIELKSYSTNKPINITDIINRRENRSDTLSLSLVSPNYLMETIKGTVVDTFGNILDINRNKIAIGDDDNLSISKIKTTTEQSDTNKNIYEQIKRAERRSLAYHFELNARKELQGSGSPDITDNSNFARNRSRFFLDIDKEGQLKLNVPASSNTGNIPLLTRYENYSTIHPNEQSQNPNDLSFPEDYKDILIESFGFDGGRIEIIDEHESEVGPINRFSDGDHIKHGMVYHNINEICQSFTQVNLYDPQEFEPTTILDPNSKGYVSFLDPIITDQIKISGPDANAGGRSASLNFDGSIEINIGANSIDNQSMWLDTEGGIVSNIGADKRGISVAASVDGNILLELGTTDDTDAAKKLGPKVFDLRVADGVGNLTIFRIDNTGLSVSTQGRYVIYSSSDIMFRSMGKITLDGEQVVINGRQFLKEPEAGYVR